MFCSISGEAPSDPVVSTKSGHLYERRLIEKIIESEGKDPHTGEDLSVEDLLPVKGNKAIKPRPVSASSVPALLSQLQNEWDATMLETFTLRQHLDTVRQELSQALYQHDAACRVIARLVKERNAARSQLQEVMAHRAAGGDDDISMGKEDEGIPAVAMAAMQQLSATLSAGRKKRAMPAGLANDDAIRGYSAKASHNIHAARAGVTCVDVSPADDSLTVSGGTDKKVLVFNRKAGKVVSSLTGHSKSVTGVSFHSSGSRILSCSADKTVRVWKANDSGFEAAITIGAHSDAVNGLSIHPTGEYVASASSDATWAFSDIATGKRFVSVANTTSAGLDSIMFHPDGLILGTGTADNVVRVWDMNSVANVATLEGHTGSVSSICFSENGYYMASGSADQTMRLWDLRKLKCIKQLNVGAAVNAVRFDSSGKFLACAADSVKVMKPKEWTELVDVSAHKGPVLDVQFGPAASFLVSGGKDKALKFYSS